MIPDDKSSALRGLGVGTGYNLFCDVAVIIDKVFIKQKERIAILGMSSSIVINVNQVSIGCWNKALFSNRGWHICIFKGRLHEPGLAANPGQVVSPGQPFSTRTPVTVYM